MLINVLYEIRNSLQHWNLNSRGPQLMCVWYGHCHGDTFFSYMQTSDGVGDVDVTSCAPCRIVAELATLLRLSDYAESVIRLPCIRNGSVCRWMSLLSKWNFAFRIKTHKYSNVHTLPMLKLHQFIIKASSQHKVTCFSCAPSVFLKKYIYACLVFDKIKLLFY